MWERLVYFNTKLYKNAFSVEFNKLTVIKSLFPSGVSLQVFRNSAICIVSHMHAEETSAVSFCVKKCIRGSIWAPPQHLENNAVMLFDVPNGPTCTALPHISQSNCNELHFKFLVIYTFICVCWVLDTLRYFFNFVKVNSTII